MNASQAKAIPLAEFIDKLAERKDKSNRKIIYYFSPFREERTPSFCVDSSRNLWYDHGAGIGGSIIDLIMELKKCDVSTALKQIDNIWAKSAPQKFVPQKSVLQQRLPLKKTPFKEERLQILKVTQVWSRKLLAYAKSRGISDTLCKRWLKQIHFTSGGKERFGLGMRNHEGGYSIRNQHVHRTSSPNSFTYLPAKKNGPLYIFEGKFDFLSLLTLEGKEELNGDVIILNSVSNAQKAIAFIESHKNLKQVYTYLDNDKAGKKAEKAIKEAFPQLEVIPMSHTYQGFNDLNDYLHSQKEITPNHMSYE